MATSGSKSIVGPKGKFLQEGSTAFGGAKGARVLSGRAAIELRKTLADPDACTVVDAPQAAVDRMARDQARASKAAAAAKPTAPKKAAAPKKATKRPADKPKPSKATSA